MAKATASSQRSLPGPAPRCGVARVNGDCRKEKRRVVDPGVRADHQAEGTGHGDRFERRQPAQGRKAEQHDCSADEVARHHQPGQARDEVEPHAERWQAAGLPAVVVEVGRRVGRDGLQPVAGPGDVAAGRQHARKVVQDEHAQEDRDAHPARTNDEESGERRAQLRLVGKQPGKAAGQLVASPRQRSGGADDQEQGDRGVLA